MRKLTLCMGLVLMVSAPLIAQAEGGAEALARWHQQNKDGGERGHRGGHLSKDAKFQGGGDSVVGDLADGRKAWTFLLVVHFSTGEKRP